MSITWTGTITFPIFDNQTFHSDVSSVPMVYANLIPMCQVVQNNFSAYFSSSGYLIQDWQTEKVIKRRQARAPPCPGQ